MERILHDLRLSETLSPFGVGAIVDVLGESLIAPDTSWWDRKSAPEISCERLLSRLGAGVLRQAPAHSGRAAKGTPHLLYWRFPAWRFCERCTTLSQFGGKNKGRFTNSCECGGTLVPMRYVAVCKKGSHIQDVPWFKWAHRGNDVGVDNTVRFCRSYKELKFVRSSQLGEGLGSLRIQCTGCDRSRPLSNWSAASRCTVTASAARAPSPGKTRSPVTFAITTSSPYSAAPPATTSQIASRRSTSRRNAPGPHERWT